MKKTIFTTVLSCLLHTILFCQSKNSLTGGFLIGSHFKNDLNGHGLDMTFEHDISPKHVIGISINYLFAESRGILPDKLTEKYALRDVTNPDQLKSFNADWNVNSFPKGSFEKTKPNRHMNYNISLQYGYNIIHKTKSRLTLGLGVGMTFNDEMNLVYLLKGEYRFVVQPANVNMFQDYYFPIFRFDTYWDLGIMPSVKYEKTINEHLIWGLNLKQNWFFKSSKTFSTLTCFFGFKF
jgi:hypothetical protein